MLKNGSLSAMNRARSVVDTSVLARGVYMISLLREEATSRTLKWINS
jgi:hypothetical protein